VKKKEEKGRARAIERERREGEEETKREYCFY
jgi:hypothetical protein